MQTFSTRNIEQLIAYPFKDPRWAVKLLILALVVLLGFIPVIPWIILAGYFARVVRAAAGTPGLPEKLPEWDDFGDLLKDGLRQFAVMFLYFLPVTLVFSAGYVIMMVNMLRNFNAYNPYANYNPYASMGLPTILGVFFLFGVAMLLTMVTGFFSPAALTHAAVKRSFAAAFQFKEWWRIFRANWKAFLVALVLILGLSYTLIFVYSILFFTIVLICLAPFAIAAMSAYLFVITGVLLGAAYREGLQTLHPAVSPAPLAPAEPEAGAEAPVNAEI